VGVLEEEEDELLLELLEVLVGVCSPTVMLPGEQSPDREPGRG